MNALAVFSVLLQYNRIYAVTQAIVIFLYNYYRVYAVIMQKQQLAIEEICRPQKVAQTGKKLGLKELQKKKLTLVQEFLFHCAIELELFYCPVNQYLNF